MKTLLTTIVSAIFFLLPITGFAGYIIHLKDGGKIVTDQYFEEGDQIKLKRYGGIIGIRKDRVLEIEKTESSVEVPGKKETTTAAEAAPAVGEGADKEQKVSSNNNGDDATKPSIPEGEKADNPLLKEFETLKKRFIYLGSMTIEELYQFDKDLLGLRDKILKAGLAGVYPNELTEILAMGSKLEDTIKARGQ